MQLLLLIFVIIGLNLVVEVIRNRGSRPAKLAAVAAETTLPPPTLVAPQVPAADGAWPGSSTPAVNRWSTKLTDGSVLFEVGDLRQVPASHQRRGVIRNGLVVPLLQEAFVLCRTANPCVAEEDWAQFDTVAAFTRKGVTKPEFTTHERVMDERGRVFEFSRELLPIYLTQLAVEDAERERAENERSRDALERDVRRQRKAADRRTKRAEDRAAATLAELVTQESLESAIALLEDDRTQPGA